MTKEERQQRLDEHIAYEMRPYGVKEGCFTHFSAKHGDTKISYFIAEISKVVIYQDGDQENKFYEIQGKAQDGEEFPLITVTAQEFASMSWTSKWGPKAVVAAGDKRDHVRVAILRYSIFYETEIIKTHTGWTDANGKHGFITRAGMITANGLDTSVRVDLGDGSNQYYDIRDHAVSPETQKTALEALMKSADWRLTAPLLALVFRAILNLIDKSRYGAHEQGETGTGKSSLLAVFQTFFGRQFTMDRFNSWSSTANSLGFVAFQAKDVICVIDDLVPKGTANDISRQTKEIDRVFREAANGNGRQRMTADGKLRQTYYPRGIIVSTGEVGISSGSLGARLLGLEFRVGDVDFDFLTTAQAMAEEGVYESITFDFIKWVLKNEADVRSNWGKHFAAHRSAPIPWNHRRFPLMYAGLMTSAEIFVSFLKSISVFNEEDLEFFSGSVRQGIKIACQLHNKALVIENDPVKFLRLLNAAIYGGFAYLNNVDKYSDQYDHKMGWHKDVNTGDVRPKGTCIGYFSQEEDGEIWLHGEVAYAVAQDFARRSHADLTSTSQTIFRRLNDSGFLMKADDGKSTLKRTLPDGNRVRVLVLRKGTFLKYSGLVAEPAPKAHSQNRGLALATGEAAT